MNQGRLAVILFAFLLFSTTSWAQSYYLHQPRLSARVMGMGGAFAALADDYNALYFNPAGLARIEKPEFNFQIDAGLTPPLIGFMGNISSAGSSVANMTQLLQSNYGNHYAARVGLGATYVRNGWGIGIQPLDLTAEMDITASAGAAVGLEAINDTLVQMGFAWTALNKALVFGIAPKAVYRGFIEKQVIALDLTNNSNIISPSDANEGMTIDTDIGAIYTLPVPDSWFFKPSFAVTVRNLIDEGFNTGDFHLYSSSSTPITNTDGKMGRRIDVGTKFDLPEFWAFKPRLMFDVRDIGYRYVSFKKALHVGAELPWKVTDAIQGAYRVGFSEGYFTAGFSFYLALLQIDVATYSEEIGTTNAPNPSQRYIAQIGFDF